MEGQDLCIDSSLCLRQYSSQCLMLVLLLHKSLADPTCSPPNLEARWTRLIYSLKKPGLLFQTVIIIPASMQLFVWCLSPPASHQLSYSSNSEYGTFACTQLWQAEWTEMSISDVSLKKSQPGKHSVKWGTVALWRSSGFRWQQKQASWDSGVVHWVNPPPAVLESHIRVPVWALAALL